ncbi:MAG TPA: SxtJ family membrane protein [Vineibacter sp.]|nr:SxtJ family membrane protein [Vineibacter sp.]
MAKAIQTHENFTRDEHLPGGSDRSFGLVFAGFFAIVAAWSWWRSGTWWPYAIGLAVLFGVVALLAPRVLGPLNRLWMRFGLLMSKVMNPIILGIMFYGVMLPIGLLLRWKGKDLLRLKLDPAAASYWIEREPPGPPPDTMRNQY